MLTGIILCEGSISQIKLIEKENFNKVIKSKQTSLFTLKNSAGMICQITNYGGRLVNLWVPDKNGVYDDIVLGFETLDDLA